MICFEQFQKSCRERGLTAGRGAGHWFCYLAFSGRPAEIIGHANGVVSHDRASDAMSRALAA